jgi:hypothetical protein
MKWLFLIFIQLTAWTSFSQETYFVREKTSNEPIPFVKIYPDQGNPFLADIDGMFKLNEAVSSFRLHASGYKDTLIERSAIVDGTILLQAIFQNIQEVMVTAGENPAHRIIDLAIANRKKNNPTENDAFQYNSYSKFIFDVNREKLDSLAAQKTDTTLQKVQAFFDQQHLFLIESASTRSFIPPARDKEEITSYKVSGFSDPMFSTFANEMQSFSFYENQVQLLGKNYINPIALGGTRRYLFIIEDTTIVDKDTTFTIFYRPRKGKNFDGMSGYLYINTNGYAIEKVIAKPYGDTSGTVLRIVQEYAYLNDKKWFPVKLSTDLVLPLNVSVEGFEIVGKGSTYIRNVSFDEKQIKKGSFDNVSVVVKEDAADVGNEEWQKVREYDITDREKRTYEMIDSLSKANNLDRRLKALKVLTEGKIPMGYFNFDLNRLLDYNLYEGVRLGGGLETSRKLMKPIVVGAYGAYGFKDKAFKYGAYSTVHLYRKKGIQLDLSYQEDVAERGGVDFSQTGFNLSNQSAYRDLFIINMDQQRLAEVAISAYAKANIKLRFAGSFQRITYTKGYAFGLQTGTFFQIPSYGTDNAEVSGELTWNIREKVMLLGDQRVSKGTKFPKIRLKAAKGLSDFYSASLDYWRFTVDIQQEFPIGTAGKFSWCLNGGQTIGTVPLFLQHVGNGTGKAWNIVAKNSFETMLPGEFYHSAQAGFFTRMDFTRFKTKAKWNEPQISLHHAIGYGEMTNKFLHYQDFRSMDKGFFEGGVILNSLFTSGFTGIGIACFYRYGYYADADWKKNIVPKIAVSFNL